jgi:anti-anti-sigma factor
MAIGAIYYAKQDGAYILKFVGDIRYTMSCALDRFLDRLFKGSDFDSIAIDLTETTAIDSTNLGLLAKIANHSRTRFDRKPLLLSTSGNINAVLDSMGFDDVFDMCRETNCANCPRIARMLEIVEPSKEEMARTMLDAHCVLSDLNEHNQREFKQVVGALRSRVAGAS